MIKISKKQAFKMRDLGLGDFVKHTYTKHKTYYLVESRQALATLEEYKKENIIERFE